VTKTNIFSLKKSIFSLKTQKWSYSADKNDDRQTKMTIIIVIFEYFCTVVPYFEYFRVIFVNSSFAFSSAFVSRVPQSTEPLYIFECKFEYEKQPFRLSRKWKIRKKILSHCLTYPLQKSATKF